MKTALLVLSAAVAFTSIGHGLPGGAPNEAYACPTMSPSVAGHGSPQNTPSPYNITGLPSEYTPGATYTCKSRRGVWYTRNAAGMQRYIKYRSRYVMLVTAYTIVSILSGILWNQWDIIQGNVGCQFGRC